MSAEQTVAAAPAELLSNLQYVESAAEGIGDSPDTVEIVLTGEGLRQIRAATAKARPE